MTTLARMRVTWTGSVVVGGGISTFYTTTPTNSLKAALQTFYTAIAGLVPTTLTWNIPSSGDTIDSATGVINGTWSEAGADATVASTLAGAYANGVGARIVWRTSGLRGNRRVVGYTFIVPLALGSYQSGGTLTDANVTTIKNAAVALLGSQALQIFAKPTAAHPTGQANPVTSGTVPDKVSWLRSRRT